MFLILIIITIVVMFLKTIIIDIIANDNHNSNVSDF